MPPTPKLATLVIALLPFTVFIHSCGSSENLIAIQEFSLLANQAAEQLPNIAHDIYDSCVRAAEYQPVTLNNDANPLDSSSVALVFGERSQSLRECDTSRLIGDGLIATHNVLITYLISLGQLASDRAINLDSISILHTSLQASPVAGLNQIADAQVRTSRESSFRILDLLGNTLRAFQNRSRLQTIQQVMSETDTQIITLIDNLTQIIEGNYLRKLRFEENAIDDYYKTYIEALVRARTEGDTQALTTTILSLDAEWRDRRESIRQRRDAAQQYIDLLRRIAVEHHQLKQQFDNGAVPTETELNRMMQAYTVELRQAVEALQLAFAD
jgi:hypothetical protein